jgi:integrase
MRLNATTVRTIALPEGVADKVFFDDDLPGFGLRARATGAKTWMVQYAIAGKTRRVVLGSTAVLDPGRARETAKDLLARVRLGHDPAREKTAARIKAGETFGALLPRFLEHQRARLKPRPFEETERHLIAHAKPLHGHPIDVVDRRLIATRLAELAKASGPAASNRVRTSLSAFFTWAAREGYIDSNPATFTNKAVENGPRERVLIDEELSIVWRAAGDGPYGAIVKLLMLTGTRRDEIASVCWSEIDMDTATITLPPARTKNRREHVIPLSKPALAILAAQPQRTMADGSPRDLVFGRGERGFSDWSGSKADLDARITTARKGRALDWTLHDFRRSLSTALHERFDVPPHVVESILGHVGVYKAGVRGVYNKAIYLDERRRALKRWAEHIEKIVSGVPSRRNKVAYLRSRQISVPPNAASVGTALTPPTESTRGKG